MSIKENKRIATIMTKFKDIAYLRNKYCYIIITSWINPNDKKIYFFKGYVHNYKAEDIIKERGITEFPVRYNPQQISDYIIDTSILEEVNYEENR